MSDTYMSESEADFDDIITSEDEWLPEKSQGKKALNRNDATEVSSENDSTGGRRDGRRTAQKKSKARKSNANADSIKRTPHGSYKNTQHGSTKSLKQPQKDSDSSGDEYLVDPNKLDLNSKFFSDDPSNALDRGALVEAHPSFDCNIGIGKLSDSSDEENADSNADESKQKSDGKMRNGKKLVTKLNEMSQAYENFQDFTQTLAKAKDQLERVTKKQHQDHSQDTAGTLDVSSLLALGETGSIVPKKDTKSGLPKGGVPTPRKSTKKTADSDSDWEDVEEQQADNTARGHSVQITLNPELAAPKPKKKCTEFDVEAHIIRTINKQKRDEHLVLHKLTIIMGIAHGNYTNAVLNYPLLLAIGKALVPLKHRTVQGPTDLVQLKQLLEYFRQNVNLKDRRMFVKSWKRLSLEESLRLQLLSQMANCRRDYILMFIIVLRSIGFQCRMVMSLQVVPKAVPNSELMKVVPSGKQIPEKKKKNSSVDHDYVADKKIRSTSGRKRKASAVVIPQLDGADDGVKRKKHSKKDRQSNIRPEILKPAVTVTVSPRKTRKQRQEAATSGVERSPVRIEADTTKSKVEKKNSRSSNKKASVTSTEAPIDAEAGPSLMIRRDYGTKEVGVAKSEEKTDPLKTTLISGRETPKKKIPKIEKFDPKTRRALDRRILSSDDEDRSKNDSKGVNLWIEVFVGKEDCWVPLDVMGTVSDRSESLPKIVQQASIPVVYVLGWNNDGSIKDVTAKYCRNYLTETEKLRIMQPWMDNTLLQFRGERTAQDIKEDRELCNILGDRPLPRTIAEYKNNQYFVLKRHLLKFEAIYPPDAPTLGFTANDEPVYARECVHTLHAREVWLKQARTVKLYETAYKVVSARPKYDRASGKMLPAQPLELFGHWQTEDYEPPTAEDGIVPRNAYGNVELFKPCMLPKKTVHLRLPALNRVCKKLRIDCAQAVTGFDFHGGSSHPVYDGFIVCEEFRDVVVDAWHQEQEAEEQRAREKYEKRVYGNWKRLIKGLLIRRKLQHKYNFDNLTQ